MRIPGLDEAIGSILGALKKPLKWGLTAVEKLPTPPPADPKKKAHRKMVDVSRRKNR